MKPKKEETAGSTAEAGIRVLTVALFIILLAFFIVLNSIAVVDEKNTLTALGSLTGSFGILPGGVSASKEGEVRVVSSEHVPVEGQETETLEISGLGDGGRGAVDVRKMPHGEVVSIRDQVLFDEGSFRIKPAAYGFLKRLCEIINSGDFPVEITGHTDDLPPEEQAAYASQEISSLRALEVFKFFVLVGEVLPDRLVAFGCGEHRPRVSNETRMTRAMNRRVDIVLARTASDGLKELYEKDQSAFVVFKRFVFRIFD